MFPRPKTAIFLPLFCLALATMQSEAQPDTGTGLEGEIHISSAPGGPARIGVSDSRPLSNTTFMVKKDEKIIASFQTDDHGRFRIFLPPGKCTVSKNQGKVKVGNYGPFEVELIAGQMKKVRWECDSGMQ